MGPTPLFIFSVPRSGSTLLQRILGADSRIATIAEPWFLLPLVYSTRPLGVYAEYSHMSVATAVQDVITSLPRGRQDYDEAIRSFAETLYGKLGGDGDVLYFLDKTPRYYFIIDDILKIFPDAKFIFLFRNPLAVMASMIKSFYRNRLGDWRHRIDLLEGPRLLADAWQRNQSRGIALRYEDLVMSPTGEIQRVFDYLGISVEDPEGLLSGFRQVDLRGQMGDQIGTKRYDGVEAATVEKWRTTLGTPIRKYYATRYLRNLGEEVVGSLGYNYHQLLKEVGKIPTRPDRIAIDLAELARCKARILFELPLLRRRRKMAVRRGGRVYPHY